MTWLGEETSEPKITANLSARARAYLASLDIADPDANAETAGLIWYHALAIGYAPAYLAENADGIRQDWPRIPLPADPALLKSSAALGRTLAALLDTESKVAGVTSGSIRPEQRRIAVLSNVVPGQSADFKVTAGWGHAGKEGVTMPGKGRTVERDYSPDEVVAMEAGAAGLGLETAQLKVLLGPTTRDVFLNAHTFWKNVPARVWDYTIGGYQVIKKWLSYREAALLQRDLSQDEVFEVVNMARRLAALILLEPQLDTNYAAVKAHVYPMG